MVSVAATSPGATPEVGAASPTRTSTAWPFLTCSGVLPAECPVSVNILCFGGGPTCPGGSSPGGTSTRVTSYAVTEMIENDADAGTIAAVTAAAAGTLTFRASRATESPKPTTP